MIRCGSSRLSVIVSPDDYDRWLTADVAAVEKLLLPSAANELTMTPVSKIVNNPRNDVSEGVEPAS
jgi:putative SOS response-associated peptidase YedK